MSDPNPITHLVYSPGPFTAKDVVDYLKRVPYGYGNFYIDLEHGYFYTANSRLTLFADETRWAIVFEKSGYANRSFSIRLELDFFGNCLENLEPHNGLEGHYYNSKYITLIDGEELSRIENDFEDLKKGVETVKIRNQKMKIPKTKAGFKKWIPNISSRSYPNKVTFIDLIRFAAYEYDELCRATEKELRLCIPNDLPKIMAIDEWHHKSYHVFDNSGTQEVDILGEPPNTYETYYLIGKVLETKDSSAFKPTLEPNNHWLNWPKAGSL